MDCFWQLLPFGNNKGKSREGAITLPQLPNGNPNIDQLLEVLVLGSDPKSETEPVLQSEPSYVRMSSAATLQPQAVADGATNAATSMSWSHKRRGGTGECVPRPL